jgi:hypothetical protein
LLSAEEAETLKDIAKEGVVLVVEWDGGEQTIPLSK